MSGLTTDLISPIQVLWQANLQRSRSTQCGVFLLYVGVSYVVILTQWPVSRWIALPFLLTGVFWDLFKAHQHVGAFQGSIALRSDRVLIWQDHPWRIRTILMTPWGVWLLLPAVQWPRLWLARDSMSPAEWRALCRTLSHDRVPEK